MTYLAVKNWDIEVRRGNITGMTKVAIFGHDDVLSTTRETIHPTGVTDLIKQDGIHRTGGTPAKVKVASTSTDDDGGGIGMLTCLLIGLDASGNAQTETITMDGQTEVTSSGTYSAINGMRALTWGSQKYNVGTIWTGTGTFTSGVPATEYMSMHLRDNKAMTAIYTVPLGKTFYLEKVVLTVATTNKDVEFYIETSLDGLNFVTEAVFGMEPGEIQFNTDALPGIPANSVVRMEAVSTGTTAVMVIMNGVLIDD